MSLIDQAKGFLLARGASAVHEKEASLLVADFPGFGGDIDRTCVWVPSSQYRHTRDPILFQDELLNRFKGIYKKYPGAKLHLLVDNLEGFPPDFRASANRDYGVKIQVPVQFFDIPFKWEIAKSAASATLDLAKKSAEFERGRIQQCYSTESPTHSHNDLVVDILKEIEDSVDNNESRVWFVIGPAGFGKSIFFTSLFGRVYNLFQNRKKSLTLFPRPFPLLSNHLNEAAGLNILGTIDAFLRTEFSAQVDRNFFNWTIENRYGFLMLDGLDEIIAKDPYFFDYIGDRLTVPNANPLILICLRDTLFNTSNELSSFFEYFDSITKVFSLKSWDHKDRRIHAWINLESRKPREGEIDTEKVSIYLNKIKSTPSLDELASSPFYADLLLQAFKDSQTKALKDERELIDYAIDEMCKREYGKGNIREEVLSISAFREWLEEIAILSYQKGGISTDDLRVIADLARILSSGDLTDDEQDKLVDNLVMAPFLKRSNITGNVELTHELLSEYFAGARITREFKDSSHFASRLSQRAWPADSMIFPVLSHNLRGNLDQLEKVRNESLSPEGFANFIQLLCMIPNGARLIQSGSIALDSSKLQGLKFRNLNLDGVSFRGTDLTNVTFDRCFLRKARFEGSILRGTSFINTPEGGIREADFGDCENFDSIFIGDRKTINEIVKLQRWLETNTGRKDPINGPCPTTRQMLFLFKKFIREDGKPRRDSLDKKGAIRGKQEINAASSNDCLESALEAGFFEILAHDRIRRASGSKYGEMVSFVKTQVLSPQIRSLLDSLCRVPNCTHIPKLK